MLQPAMICNWDEYVNGFVLSLCSKVGLQKDLHTGNMCLEDDNGDLIVLDYKGKFLRFPLDCYNSLFNDWIMFDPLYNKNVMKFINRKEELRNLQKDYTNNLNRGLNQVYIIKLVLNT